MEYNAVNLVCTNNLSISMYSSEVIKRVYFSLFIILFFGVVIGRIILEPITLPHEFGAHIYAARHIGNEGELQGPHFLWHVITVMHQKALQYLPFTNVVVPNRKTEDIEIGWHIAGWLVTIEFIVATVLILQVYLQSKFQSAGSKLTYKLSYLFAFCICIVMPLFMLAPLDGKYYLGYLSPSTSYVVPTQIALKLTALLLFFTSASLFEKVSPISSTKLVCLSLLVICCGLTKPNFLIIMLPALFLLASFRWLKDRAINLMALNVVFVTSFIVLGWQFYFQFVSGHSLYKSSILITWPFELMRLRADYVWAKILLSMAFPLYVLVLCRDKLKNLGFQYAWILFIFGLIFSAFLAEGEGRTRMAGNFVWSGQIGLFILFVSSVETYYVSSKELLLTYPRSYKFGWLVFMGHVICGLIYYVRSFWYSYY